MSSKEIVVFTSGFSSGSLGAGLSESAEPINTGMGQLSSEDIFNESQYEQKLVAAWDEPDRVIDAIVQFHSKFPDGKINLIGHSFGADTNIEIANRLADQGITVYRMVSVDSVGIDDSARPDNVVMHLNLYSSSGKGVDGERYIDGAINKAIDDSSHTEVDEERTTWDEIAKFFSQSPDSALESELLSIPSVYDPEDDNHLLGVENSYSEELAIDDLSMQLPEPERPEFYHPVTPFKPSFDQEVMDKDLYDTELDAPFESDLEHDDFDNDDDPPSTVGDPDLDLDLPD